MAEKIVPQAQVLGHVPKRWGYLLDKSSFSPLELLVAMIVEHAGGFYRGLQPGFAPGQHTLVLFNASFGATSALPIDELSTQAIRQKLELMHAEFGIPWDEDHG